MKIKLKELLNGFRASKKSIVAFNLQNFYQLEAAQSISNQMKTPIMIQFSERYLRFLNDKYGIDYLINKFSGDYVYFHLDHCVDLDFIKLCIDSGFDSVMFDGSSFDIDTNIEKSLEIINYAKKSGCLVEGELGKVSGVEDGFGDEGSSYAEISEIKRYVNETNIDLMALGIGNAHGFYTDLKDLKMNILKEASKSLNNNQLYVLHGGTGLPEEIVKEAISYGVVKINVSTQLKKNTIDVMKHYVSVENLYNEIAFSNLMLQKLGDFFKSYLNKYTK